MVMSRNLNITYIHAYISIKNNIYLYICIYGSYFKQSKIVDTTKRHFPSVQVFMKIVLDIWMRSEQELVRWPQSQVETELGVPWSPHH